MKIKINYNKTNSAEWANEEQTAINLIVYFEHLGEAVPFTATAEDREEHGRILFEKAVNGDFGPIAPYVSPPTVTKTPSAQEKLDAILEWVADDTTITVPQKLKDIAIEVKTKKNK